MCQILNVKRSSYYAWTKRPESRRAEQDRMIIQEIRIIHKDNNKKGYGSPRMKKELEHKGLIISKKRVARLMKMHNIKAITAVKYKPQTKPVPEENASPNLLGQNFITDKPNKIWVTDITYILTKSGWVYLCTFMDLYSRKIVGWSIGLNMKTGLVLRALQMAINKRKPGIGLIIHSDRGSQYGSSEYRDVLKTYGFIQSMSRKGNCWDNACMESFYHILKYEYLFQFILNGLEDVKWLCFKFIEAFYNSMRLHSYLGYISPADFEKKKWA
jgi:putative transposase